MDLMDAVAFGPLSPGQSTACRIYARNEGNVPFTLYMSASNWVLRDSSGGLLSQDFERYFSVTWDYDNSLISPGEIREITITLAVSSSLVDVSTYSLDVVISAVQ